MLVIMQSMIEEHQIYLCATPYYITYDANSIEKFKVRLTFME